MKNNKILLFASLIVIAACTPVTAERGNMLEDYQLKEVLPGSHTRSDVLKILGSPTTQAPFDDNTWYYIGEETEKKGILDPKIVKERIIVVRFDDTGTVNSVQEMPKNSRMDVPIESAKTETKGNEFTFMQQLLGNMGRFNNTAEKGRAGAN